MTRTEVDVFEKLQGQMNSLHEEIGALSKKVPNDALNKFKLTLINKLLSESNVLLAATFKPLADFNQFDEVDIPSNSDVTLVLAQYLNGFEQLRCNNITCVAGYKVDLWYWEVDGRQSDIRTSPPRKLT
jgi:aspartate carbamoyltransferase regulatory subunit